MIGLKCIIDDEQLAAYIDGNSLLSDLSFLNLLVYDSALLESWSCLLSYDNYSEMDAIEFTGNN